MPRLAALTCVLLCLGVLAGPAAAQRDGERARTLVVDVLVMNDAVTVVDANQSGAEDAGDYIVGTADILRRGTSRKIGTASFTALRVSDSGFELFSAALRLRGADLFVEGHIAPGDVVAFDAIVGGTKRFAGARGQVRERNLGEGDDTSAPSFRIRLRMTFTTLRGRDEDRGD
jgi:hypothetical protein